MFRQLAQIAVLACLTLCGLETPEKGTFANSEYLDEMPQDLNCMQRSTENTIFCIKLHGKIHWSKKG